jgi:hypothetical protein
MNRRNALMVCILPLLGIKRNFKVGDYVRYSKYVPGPCQQLRLGQIVKINKIINNEKEHDNHFRKPLRKLEFNYPIFITELPNENANLICPCSHFELV